MSKGPWPSTVRPLHPAIAALHRAMVARGWTQQQLAEQAELHQETVGEAFRGKRSGLVTIDKIAQALGLELTITERQKK